MLFLCTRQRNYVVSANGIYPGQGEIAVQALTQYVAARDVIPDYRNFAWVEGSLGSDIADHVWTYISSTPAYEWPLTARYTVFPEIYGYLEVPDLLKSWDELLKIESFHWEEQIIHYLFLEMFDELINQMALKKKIDEQILELTQMNLQASKLRDKVKALL